MKFGRRAGAGFLILVRNAIHRLGKPVVINRRRTLARAFFRVITEHRVVTRIRGSINSGSLLSTRALFSRKAGLLSPGRRDEKKRSDKNYKRWDRVLRRILMHCLPLRLIRSS